MSDIKYLDKTGLGIFWSRLKGAFAPLTHRHNTSDVDGLATVSTSGSYTDLSNKPTIPIVPSYMPVTTVNGSTTSGYTIKITSNTSDTGTAGVITFIV